jgi:hypothetical protein
MRDRSERKRSTENMMSQQATALYLTNYLTAVMCISHQRTWSLQHSTTDSVLCVFSLSVTYYSFYQSNNPLLVYSNLLY